MQMNSWLKRCTEQDVGRPQLQDLLCPWSWGLLPSRCRWFTHLGTLPQSPVVGIFWKLAHVGMASDELFLASL